MTGRRDQVHLLQAGNEAGLGEGRCPVGSSPGSATLHFGSLAFTPAVFSQEGWGSLCRDKGHAVELG